MCEVPQAVQRVAHSDELPWHQHHAAYAAVVLEGGYHESGEDGRRSVRAGDVVIHQPYSGHLNRFDQHGALIFNVKLPRLGAADLVSGRCDDPAKIVTELQADPTSSAKILRRMITATPGAGDLPDMLARALSADAGIRLEIWADAHGVSQRTLRRQFTLAYGMSPSAFRARARARSAWKLIVNSMQPLADISFAVGFADQAHMSRAVRQLTSMSPMAARAYGRLVQD